MLGATEPIEAKLVSHFSEDVGTPEPIYEQKDIHTGEEIDLDRFERPLAEVSVDIRPSEGELPEGLKIDERLANEHARKMELARQRQIATCRRAAVFTGDDMVDFEWENAVGPR